MSTFTQILKSLYPLRMKLSKATGLGIRIYSNTKEVTPPVSFYSLQATLTNGEIIRMEKYKGRKILIVNLASLCGFTRQYEELEQLYLNNNSIVVLGFPSNNFGRQEPGTDATIAEFCRLNYGVTFPVFKKDNVIGDTRQSIYDWLSDKNKNGWNETSPKWNFYKFLVDENGNLDKVFSSSVSPKDIIK